MFRGVDIRTGEWVYGYYFRIWNKHYILWGTINDIPTMTEVHPDSIAMDTGQTDKHDKQIFGSIWIDGKLTRGGDRLKYYNQKLHIKDVIWRNNRNTGVGFNIAIGDNYEIIGTQYTKLKEMRRDIERLQKFLAGDKK